MGVLHNKNEHPAWKAVLETLIMAEEVKFTGSYSIPLVYQAAGGRHTKRSAKVGGEGNGCMHCIYREGERTGITPRLSSPEF